MRELLLDLPRGRRFDAVSYAADFDERFWRIGEEGFWKLECLQDYQETGFPSWEAFRAGDWDGALRLVEELRPGFTEYYARSAAAGFGLHRVRVVEEPVTPYTQWEMQLLRLREQCGEAVRVIAAAPADTVGRLPDVVVLGTEAVYQVHYTQDGTPDGATLFTERAVVDGARDFIQRLHRSGERLATWFPKHIADLEPPKAG